MSNISSVAAGTAHTPIVREAGGTGGVRRAGDCAECSDTSASVPEIRTRAADSVDFSELARRLAQRPTTDTYRPELVDRIRADIESGEYDSPELLDLALDRMINSLDVQG